MENKLRVIGYEENVEKVLDVNDLDVLYSSGTYTLYRDVEGNLYEYTVGEETLNATTVWKLCRKTFMENPIDYQSMDGWKPFLKELQANSPSIVDKLITECKGYDLAELQAWMKERSSDELEELLNFGRIVHKYSETELVERYTYDESDDDYYV